MKQPNILIADDDRTLRRGLALALRELNYELHEAASVREATELLQACRFDLVISDMKIPEVSDGLQIVEMAKRSDANPMVLVITGFGSIEIAVEAMKAGADDFVAKDAGLEEIKLKVEKLLELHRRNQEHLQLLAENERLKSELEKKYRFENLVGNSKVFRDTLKLVGKVAEDGQCSVLLRGESGTGKELIARAIHYNSPRKDKPYVVVNIAAVPNTLLESELFGHVKGAFTDAGKDRDGKLKLADGGTLLLDEIGDISANLQVKILRFLQERSFEPLGSNETQQVDVRVLAATNQNLEQKLAEKSFREDLFYRLNVVPIALPSLRERKEDLALLTEFFLRKFCDARGKQLRLGSGILESLVEYQWPGNVRELANVIEQLVVLANKPLVTVDDLPTHFKRPLDEEPIEQDTASLAAARSVLLRGFETRFVAKALDKHDWNISQTARAIGISREGLHRMVKKYGLQRS